MHFEEIFGVGILALVCPVWWKSRESLTEWQNPGPPETIQGTEHSFKMEQIMNTYKFGNYSIERHGQAIKKVKMEQKIKLA